MPMTIDEHMNFMRDRHEKSVHFMNKGVAESNYMIAFKNANWAIHHLLELGILQWRRQENPTEAFIKMMDFHGGACKVLESLDARSLKEFPLDDFQTIYAAFLVRRPLERISLEALDGQPKIDAFIGNVILGYDDISNWSLYRDILVANKRHDLARRTNELYVGLLSGALSAEEGVVLGERLWAEREDDAFYSSGLHGNGLGNERMVDYQLGAILKKIGSTVPTVHAWRW